MNENKLSLPRSSGRGEEEGEAEVSMTRRAGCPLKGPRRPRRSAAGKRAERGAGGRRLVLSGGDPNSGSAHRTRAHTNTHARTCACTSALTALPGAPSHGDPATESPTPAQTQKLRALREVTP